MESYDLCEKAPFLYKGSDGLGKENGRHEWNEDSAPARRMSLLSFLQSIYSA